MAFRVGQKVVCVLADDDESLPGLPCGLVKGVIYTVSGTGFTHQFDPQGLPCISLFEEGEYVFWQHRFRPVVERKTDISVFKAMLNRNPEKVG